MLQAKSQIAKLMVDAEAEIARSDKSAEAIRQVAEKYYMPVQEVVGNYHDVFSKLAGGDNFYTNTIKTVDNNESLRRLTWLAIKMKGVSGQLKLPPEALQPAWADPFSGKPFVLKRSGPGFILYGVGVDGKDDGGSGQMTSDDWPLDIVVKIP